MSGARAAKAADYTACEGSDLNGLAYAQLDVGDAQAIEGFKPPFERLDVLVLARGRWSTGAASSSWTDFAR